MTYTDYPEADIKTHRNIALFCRGLGVAITALAVDSIANDDGISGFVLIGLGMGAIFVAFNMELEAMRWELEQNE